MPKNNQGNSMIEIVCVLAFMGLLLGGAIGLMGMQNNVEAKTAYSELQSYVSKARTGALSKTGDVFLEIYCSKGNTSSIYLNYYEQGKMHSQEHIHAEILIEINNYGSMRLNCGESLIIAYDCNTSQWYPMDQACALTESATLTVDRTEIKPFSNLVDGYCQVVTVMKGERVVGNLNFSPFTGTFTTKELEEDSG